MDTEVRPPRLGRLRRRCPWLEHVFRAAKSFSEHYGTYYAAAITYFSVLALVPVVMVAFAVAAFVLAGNHAVMERLMTEIRAQMPGAFGDTVGDLVRGAVDARGTVGAIGLLVGLGAGVGWMTHLRAALTEQWRLQRPALPVVSTAVKDLFALLGLGFALVVSFAITAAGAVLPRLTTGLSSPWATTASVVLALTMNWLLFLWVIARLPRRPVVARAAIPGALLAAVGFEVLKQIASILLAKAAHSPAGAVFGPVIGVLVFANATARLLLFATAWTATSASRPPEQ
ncbi:YhjD/YihY/BrkB family envelope integrity protein [Amycolatopsis sp. RTGN1]|uniref:YhjD/YihY/BrkB family envelope integrity protein n=1 Tax=Amycolatopsis ponsaeliensis TaxID=2992142 RepID=UPI002551147A|nr:YhjD/YihY/BrkB family envelope integrity protein [Amycolatopsis sp. RTGN1]